jgi:hypothetical protein
MAEGSGRRGMWGWCKLAGEVCGGCCRCICGGGGDGGGVRRGGAVRERGVEGEGVAGREE